MKKVIEIKSAHTHLFRIFDKVCFNKFVTGGERINLSYFDGSSVQIIEPGFFFNGVQVGNSYMWQPLNGKGLKVWDKNFNVIREEDWEIYFGGIEQYFKNKFIAIRVEDGISRTNIYSENLSFTRTVNNLIIAASGSCLVSTKQDKKIAEAYGIEDAKLKWSVDVSVFESAKRFDKHGRDRGPTQLDLPSGSCGIDTIVFLPLTYGQLLALNAADGSLKWIKDYNGYSACFDNHLYQLNGPELLEIDPENGNILRTLEFRKYIDKPTVLMAQPFKVYEDIILLQGSKSVIAVVDRKTFELIDWFQPSGWESTRIPASNSVMHWCNNCVHVVDMNEVLHIYELE